MDIRTNLSLFSILLLSSSTTSADISDIFLKKSPGSSSPFLVSCGDRTAVELIGHESRPGGRALCSCAGRVLACEDIVPCRFGELVPVMDCAANPKFGKEYGEAGRCVRKPVCRCHLEFTGAACDRIRTDHIHMDSFDDQPVVSLEAITSKHEQEIYDEMMAMKTRDYMIQQNASLRMYVISWIQYLMLIVMPLLTICALFHLIRYARQRCCRRVKRLESEEERHLADFVERAALIDMINGQNLRPCTAPPTYDESQSALRRCEYMETISESSIEVVEEHLPRRMILTARPIANRAVETPAITTTTMVNEERPEDEAETSIVLADTDKEENTLTVPPVYFAPCLHV